MEHWLQQLGDLRLKLCIDLLPSRVNDLLKLSERYRIGRLFWPILSTIGLSDFHTIVLTLTFKALRPWTLAVLNYPVLFWLDLISVLTLISQFFYFRKSENVHQISWKSDLCLYRNLDHGLTNVRYTKSPAYHQTSENRTFLDLLGVCNYNTDELSV